MSVFRPLLIGNYYENGTVHNSCFFRTFPVSLGLYYKGRQFACWLSKWVRVYSMGGRIKIGSPPIHCARNISPTPLYLLCAHTFSQNSAPNPFLTVQRVAWEPSFWVFGPKGVKKLQNWRKDHPLRCALVWVGSSNKSLRINLIDRVGVSVFLFFYKKRKSPPD